MNPKGPTDLDPKLKETYERIMGTSFATPQRPPAPTQGPIGQPIQPLSAVQAPPQQQPEQPKTQQPVFTTTQIPEPPPLPAPEPKNLAPEMVQSPVFNPGNPFTNTPPLQNRVFTKNVVNTDSQTQEHKKNNLMPVILSLGGVVFFVVYTIVWAKVFGVI